MAKKPRVTGGMALLFGYRWAALRRSEAPGQPGIDAFSQGGANEEAESHFPLDPDAKKSGQLFTRHKRGCDWERER